MEFFSTRGGQTASWAQAVERGLCTDGGLFVPEAFPQIDIGSLARSHAGYGAVAHAVLSPFLGGLEAERLTEMIRDSYASFDTPSVAPLVWLTDQLSVLELWHGPTMAFKDVALQFLPRLMTEAVRINGGDRTIYILVATSGDTGKAALAGFADVPRTKVLVFYPEGGVSQAQRLQMVTQQGGNVDVCAVRGNFDDAQTGVKRIFSDESVRAQLERRGERLSSANSINLGRLLPQIVYYFTSYLELTYTGKLELGQPVNFCVPTGNFGDILAGYYAKRMGLPVKRFLLASNQNDVLADFIRTGVYDKNRPFYRSMSCSIDILISSNLERLLYELTGRDTTAVRRWMGELSQNGRFDIGQENAQMLRQQFCAQCCSEEETLSTVKRVFERHNYLMDPHTAVAQTVYEKLAAQGETDGAHTVLLSTANPYKFATAVLSAFETPADDDFINVERLYAFSGAPVPDGIAQIRGKKERFTEVIDADRMTDRVLR